MLVNRMFLLMELADLMVRVFLVYYLPHSLNYLMQILIIETLNAVTNAFHLFFVVVLILGVHLNQLKELFFDARVPEFIYTDRSGQ